MNGRLLNVGIEAGNTAKNVRNRHISKEDATTVRNKLGCENVKNVNDNLMSVTVSPA